jgi:hypothetical protein
MHGETGQASEPSGIDGPVVWRNWDFSNCFHEDLRMMASRLIWYYQPRASTPSGAALAII